MVLEKQSSVNTPDRKSWGFYFKPTRSPHDLGGLSLLTKGSSPNLYPNTQGTDFKSPSLELHAGAATPSRLLLLLLLSHLSRVRLCATPETATHQAPPSLGFSRQEHWSGLPWPSPMHESKKGEGSCSVVFNSPGPHGLQPTRLLHPWDFPGKRTGVGCHCLLQ